MLSENNSSQSDNANPEPAWVQYGEQTAPLTFTVTLLIILCLLFVAVLTYSFAASMLPLWLAVILPGIVVFGLVMALTKIFSRS